MKQYLELGTYFASATTAYRVHAAAIFKKHHLVSHQAQTLLMLWFGSKDQKMKEVAGELNLEASNFTAVADKLEELGLIRRQPDTKDRRVKIITLTAKGERIAEKLAEEVSHLPALNSLTAHEIDQLIVLLSKISYASRRSMEAAGDENADT